ncbi:YslB family protein [Mesobacillus harenae]|uniref:YslB family protein n=1 Tax=Mesobacillus harenae TaxID=2213203 RepID=UPI00157FD120|nr:YslB family protein [Mesobacillus harenae]
MSKLTTSDKTPTNEPAEIAAFGYELIREVLLPDLLGKDTKEILYWAGKRLARKYPLTSIDDLSRFFVDANWGTLSLKEETRKEIVFELTSSLITERLKNNKETSFTLEAGFLAEQLVLQKQLAAEAFEQPAKKSGKVLITVKWDK